MTTLLPNFINQLQSFWLSVGLVFVGSFVATYILIPKILWVAYSNRLVLPANERSSHKGTIASFGGVAFFIIFLILLSLIQLVDLDKKSSSLVVMSLTILFTVGLKDDLSPSSPRVKIIGELLAISLILFIPDIQIQSAFGFLNIFELHNVLTVPISIFIVLGCINAYNLIDGIDGLAGIIGIIIFCTYGLIFYFSNQYYYFYISLCSVAMLLAFLRYNLSPGNKKIFMGDTGSLIIGFLIGLLSLRFLACNPLSELNTGLKSENVPILALAIFFIPTFDTTRIIITRLVKGHSPFKADRDHSHHILIDLGLTHCRASLVLGSLNLFVIITFFLLCRYYNSFVITIFMVLVFLLSFLLFHSLKTRNKLNSQ